MEHPSTPVGRTAVSDPARQLLTRREAADYLGLAEQTLRKQACRRFGPPFLKVGGRVRYRLADIDAWLDARRVDHDGDAAASADL